MTSQQQFSSLINIPKAITREKGIGAQQGTSAERKRWSWKKCSPVNGVEVSVRTEILQQEPSEGQQKNL